MKKTGLLVKSLFAVIAIMLFFQIAIINAEDANDLDSSKEEVMLSQGDS
ncbi:MAG: hypothetical protein ACP5OG_01385 [Candidatus Nanoarchaeia archaeon]